MTTYRVLCDGELIGTSELENRDSAMRLAWGLFVPSPAYERVRHVFRLFATAQRDTGPADDSILATYYRARDQLALTLETQEGEAIPTNFVHIADFRDEVDAAPCEVEIQSDAPSLFVVDD